MSKYSYTYNRNAGPKPELRYYTRDELELMTTYQLRDICYRERIINGIHAPLDKDVLIREIMRFRGRADRLFITEPSEDGLERLGAPPAPPPVEGHRQVGSGGHRAAGLRQAHRISRHLRGVF